MFVTINDMIVPISEIQSVDISELQSETIIVSINNKQFSVTGFEALEIIWLVKPSALEGNTNIKWKKNMWVIHNLIAHPLMQILAFFKFYKQAIWLHDITVPKPIGYKNGKSNN